MVRSKGGNCGELGPAVRLALETGLEILARTNSRVSEILDRFVQIRSPLLKKLGVIFYISSLWAKLKDRREATVSANRT